MKLSEAIRLGSMLVTPQANLFGCAITMAVRATGDISIFAYGETLLERWPWLDLAVANCPQCGQVIGERRDVVGEIIFHVFDSHVIEGHMTIDEMADWVASIEPVNPPSRDAGIFVNERITA